MQPTLEADERPRGRGRQDGEPRRGGRDGEPAVGRRRERLGRCVADAVQRAAGRAQGVGAARPADDGQQRGQGGTRHDEGGREARRRSRADRPGDRTDGQQRQGKDDRGDRAALARPQRLAQCAGAHRSREREAPRGEGLDERERGERQRGHVHAPARQTQREAGQPRPRREQPAQGRDGPAHGHRRAAARAGVLQQVAAVEGQRGQQGEAQSCRQGAHGAAI